MTMVRDEGLTLPRWIDYYGGQVGQTNLIVLDDNSIDGSTQDLPCTVFRLPPPPWKRPWSKTRLQLANSLSRGLLACHDAVIFTDVDEFLVPDPARYVGLSDYLASTADRRVVAPLALEVLHNDRLEPALDENSPLLQQRRFVKFSPAMCKPLVKRVPQNWDGAFHRIHAPFEVDPDLWMLHLKYADVTVLDQVAEQRRQVHEQENRGHPKSFWPMGAAALREKLVSWTMEAETNPALPEFDAGEVDLNRLIAPFGDGTWTASANQVASLDDGPLRELPERFRDAF